MSQRATITGLRLRSPSDARVIFHAVHLKILPMVTRRLDNDERSLIQPGSVYVWEERGPNAELTGTGIERWTDGIRWGPSRVREGFLFYQEKQDDPNLYAANAYRPSNVDPAKMILTKQTYTVYVVTPAGKRKWHLIAYFTDASLDRLKTVDDIPQLAGLAVPHEKYQTARAAKGRPEHIFNTAQSHGAPYTRLEYVPYTPKHLPPSPSPSPVSFSPTVMRSVSTSPSVARRQSPSATSPLTKDTPSRRHNTMQFSPSSLPPLEYLRNQPRVRRFPGDEMALAKLAHGQ
ncbi:Gti1/Pac2 family-domain-containing protein [Desarmillaria ectypa]|nr:Gti1/Pac2 family-domain-containing protein [Desarmillaria ectypa]